MSPMFLKTSQPMRHRQPMLPTGIAVNNDQSPLTPPQLWPLALAELKHQMTRATFNAWLVDSHLVPRASRPTFFVIAVGNQFAYEWLTYRLQSVVVRTLVGVVGQTVTVCFIPRHITPMRRSHDEPARRPLTRILGSP